MDEAYNAELVRWYDHWLKGVDNGIMDEPPVKIHVRGAGWREEHEWPLAADGVDGSVPGRTGALAELRRREGSDDFTQPPILG